MGKNGALIGLLKVYDDSRCHLSFGLETTQVEKFRGPSQIYESHAKILACFVPDISLEFAVPQRSCSAVR